MTVSLLINSTPSGPSQKGFKETAEMTLKFGKIGVVKGIKGFDF